MHRFIILIASLITLPVLARAQDDVVMAEQQADSERAHLVAKQAAKQMRQRALADRFRHREARIRDAVARGDLTEAEAARLRARLEERRDKIHLLRQQRRARMEAQRARAAQVEAAEAAEAAGPSR
ncbi:hypothetical protein [Chitinimonas sp. BJYL2]|uniref:hypothetical protein n=1 Tax=Chitinimonas sp. BJYL2 TaxID=2976696 RepID=UPI0022B40DAD|nr:hypothetical protein [Chitinimonas sp. BJYL2]